MAKMTKKQQDVAFRKLLILGEALDEATRGPDDRTKRGPYKAIAAKLGISPPSINDWKNRGCVPVQRVRALVEAAKEMSLEITEADLRPDIFG